MYFFINTLIGFLTLALALAATQFFATALLNLGAARTARNKEAAQWLAESKKKLTDPEHIAKGQALLEQYDSRRKTR